VPRSTPLASEHDTTRPFTARLADPLQVCFWAISDVQGAVTRCLPALCVWARGRARGPSGNNSRAAERKVNFSPARLDADVAAVLLSRHGRERIAACRAGESLTFLSSIHRQRPRLSQVWQPKLAQRLWGGDTATLWPGMAVLRVNASRAQTGALFLWRHQ
jgi:hypothetical protein